jgi:hypothetical protein
MTPESEQKLLQSLYDRLFEAITYFPGGGKPPISTAPQTTFSFQKPRPQCLRRQECPESVESPGDQRTALAFSKMVDQIPNVAADFSQSGKTVSGSSKVVVDNANTDNKIDPAQKATYDKAYLSYGESFPESKGLSKGP